MPGPGACWRYLPRPPPESFGLGILARLLEAESAHAEDVAVPRHRFVPGVMDAGDGVAMVLHLAGVEVDEMRDLQREHVARVIDQQFLQALYRAPEIAVAPGRQGGDVTAYARH